VHSGGQALRHAKTGRRRLFMPMRRQDLRHLGFNCLRKLAHLRLLAYSGRDLFLPARVILPRPFTKQAPDCSGFRRSVQAISKCLIRKHLRYGGQDPQVLLVGVLGNQDHEEGRHWLMICRAKRYWNFGTHEQYHRFSDTGDTSVRDRDTMSKCGGSTLLPSPKSSEDHPVIDLVVTGGERGDRFAHSLGVGRREPEHDILAREKTTDRVHKALITLSKAKGCSIASCEGNERRSDFRLCRKPYALWRAVNRGQY